MSASVPRIVSVEVVPSPAPAKAAPQDLSPNLRGELRGDEHTSFYRCFCSRGDPREHQVLSVRRDIRGDENTVTQSNVIRKYFDLHFFRSRVDRPKQLVLGWEATKHGSSPYLPYRACARCRTVASVLNCPRYPGYPLSRSSEMSARTTAVRIVAPSN